MSADDPARHGPAWVPLLLAGAVLVAALPMLAGIVVTAAVPWFGTLRVPVWTVLLHVLWMYPVLWLYSLVADPIEKFYVTAATHNPGRNPGRLPPGFWIERLADVAAWLVLALMYTVVFTDTVGVLVSSLLTALLYKPTLALLERTAPPENDS
ncbi:hypothetical protein H5392_13955 [Tessaracoccus sp. MC1865]|uniref:hypothetical protein n=1 Tax=Tessaracoccus sp. MC1865 TaxID=2760310 RepID=UPI001601C1CA|nr:hypothetical protein [Tessaracoccus sp. MC1865]MBB1484961.1 hypothetical protein [Tessaracoccus sp. MC1865]QTO38692.1 hypothetical protein J7D54_06370 [Tessaracoccus sp. MC1865]